MITMPEYLYEDCTVVRWVDGDTLDMQARAHFQADPVVIDPGFKFRITMHQSITAQYEGRFRLLHVDAYERRHLLGPTATEFVRDFMPEGEQVMARTYKDPDNFGRYLADLWLPDEPQITVSMALIDAQLGVPYAK